MASMKGPMPKTVLAQMKEGLDQLARDPFPVYLEPPVRTREKIAKAYGTTADQIALTCNTTDALTLAMMGIDWKPGDELLMTPMEYPVGIALALRIAARYGVIVRQWGVPVAPRTTVDQIVAAMEKQIVPGKTKVVYFSSPLWPNGMRLPELVERHAVGYRRAAGGGHAELLGHAAPDQRADHAVARLEGGYARPDGLHHAMAATARSEAERLVAEVFGVEAGLLATKGEGAWLRKDAPNGQSVMHAKAAADQGLTLSRVIAFQFGA